MSEATMRPQFLKAMESLDARIGKGVEPRVREMVRLRCSYINGCAYCIRLHSEQLASLGASTHLISALARPVKLMRDDLVSPAEAAALRFAEVLTDYPRGLEIETRDEAGKYFDAEALGSLVEIIAVVNAWNRVTRGSE
ncbi:carboxymuconolactone decarboxylase family protein [Demequina aurantiaca]|uniref:carboxymuconolactone decarboxylase family protein n=1 Tax=Demequina aurantiaca TaxID=676200 RepID=UPI00128AED4B|nr:carboxymuconolactone decarboxylase family protein [Demequina aurantiaca]